MAIKKKSMITGALILTGASVVTRLLGFVYRVYMSKTIGAEGMGLYQMIMPLYSLAWSISCSGFTTTIAKIVAQENAKKRYGNMGRALKQSLLITCSVAVLLSVLLYLLSGYIAFAFLGDDRIALSLKILSLALPFMAAGSCVRGYFFGLQEAAVPAISQVFEQIVRMAVIYALAGFFVPLGLAYACAAAVIGIFFGEFLSFLYVFQSYRLFKRKNNLMTRPDIASGQMLSMLLALALPLTLNRLTGSLLATVENLLIPQRLELYGYTAKEAVSLFGQITGMALPLIFFPSAILYALSTTLVPAVSEALAVGNQVRIRYTVGRALLFTAVIGIGASTVFITFPAELGMAIYDQDISFMLCMLGWMCPLWYMNITFSGILNGLGEQVFMFRNSLLSSAINIGCIFFLVPRYGLGAFIAGWFVSLAVAVFLALIKIKRLTGIEILVGDWFLKPALSAAAVGLCVNYLANGYLFPALGSLFGLGLGLGLLTAGYLACVLGFRVIRVSEIRALFKGLPRRKEQQVSAKDKSTL